MRTRLVPAGLLTVLAALVLAACGGGGGAADPASVVPAKTPLYVEAAIHPEGELKSNVEALAEKIAGVEDLGELIVTELEKSAEGSGDKLDFATEVEPWLGEKGALFFERYDGNDVSGFGLAIQTTDTGATEEFIEKHAGSEGEPAEDGSFEGVDFKVDPGGTTLGIVDDLFLLAEDEATFKEAVEAANGESLAADTGFTSAIDAASDESLVDVYVDIGGLIEQAGGEIDAETGAILEGAGIDPENATAVISLVPGSDQIEVDVSTNVSESEPGNASKLLESLPGGSAAAFATANFGTQLRKLIDSIDEQGVPGQLKPGELKAAMGVIGIDLDKIAESLQEGALFIQGNTAKNLVGAIVFTTSGSEAQQAVGQLGQLLRISKTPGVRVLSGKVTGFSYRSADLGPKPLVVAASGNRVAISYGLAASAQALNAGQSATLAQDPAFKEAKAALGETPISGFVDGPATLALIRGITAGTENQESFEEAEPYLGKIAFAAIGTGFSGELATSKIIVGLTE